MTEQIGPRTDPQDWHLAQVNIARPVAELTTPRLAGFVAQLEPINALADAAPGFVWRLQDEGGDATSIPVFGDRMLIVNLTVWESLATMQDFVFRTAHVEVMKQRRQWFVPMADAYTVLWWVPAGHRPTVAEAERRLLTLRTEGPTPEAFTMRRPFPAPDGTPVEVDDSAACPA